MSGGDRRSDDGRDDVQRQQPNLFDEGLPAAFDGLAEEVIEAITAQVSPDMVRAFVDELGPEPRAADAVRVSLHRYGWFPTHTKPDTQRRFLRVLRDAALLEGYPVCSINEGLLLGDRAMVLKSAERARALGRGAFQRAAALDRIAAHMPQEG